MPHGLHRIRHYGLLASGGRAAKIVHARELLHMSKPPSNPIGADTIDEPPMISPACPCCRGRMIIIETFERGSAPATSANHATVAVRIDTS